jgi:hypothetical protein
LFLFGQERDTFGIEDSRRNRFDYQYTDSEFWASALAYAARSCPSKIHPRFRSLESVAKQTAKCNRIGGLISPYRIDRKGVNGFLCFSESSYMRGYTLGQAAQRATAAAPGRRQDFLISRAGNQLLCSGACSVSIHACVGGSALRGCPRALNPQTSTVSILRYSS